MICTKCKRDLPLDSFHIRKDTKGGYRKECKECVREKMLLKYHENPDANKRKAKEQYAKHGDKRRAESRKWNTENKERVLFNLAKGRAMQFGIPFDITLEDVIIPATCPVLGIPLCRDNRGMQDTSPTLDRYVPSLGYTKGNVSVISNKANRIKNTANIEELTKVLTWCKEKELI